MKKIFLSGMAILVGAGSFAAIPTTRGGRTVSGTSAAPQGAPVSARAAARPGVVSVGAPTAPKTVAARSATTPTANTGAPAVVGARAASMQKVIQTGSPTIAGANSSSGIVSEECKAKYFGCMDSFCMQDNTNGGRCLCSDQVKTYDSILSEIEKLDAQSLKLATDGVDRIDMGEKAGEIDKMVQNATAAVNTQPKEEVTTAETKKRQRRSLDLDAFNNIGMEENGFEPAVEAVEKDPLEGLTGTALHDGVRSICLQQVGAGCEKDIRMLQMMYSTQIKSDCGAYEMELKKRRNASSQKLATAQRAMKDAALDAFEAQNKWDLGQCITEMKKCVISTGGCGEDFTKCTFYNTGEGLSGNSTPVNVPGASQTIKVGQGTLDSIQSKRKLCETSVTKNCVAVKEQVWPSLLVEIAPALKSAELIAENSQRMNKLSDIADCFNKACKDNMDPKNPEGSYDACLGNPAVMASSCKVVLDRAGVKVDDSDATWGFVKQRLGAMRVDACTSQVKSCLSSENACGENYAGCIGLGLEDVKLMCPVAKLTGCSENGVMKKNLDEINDMIVGIFLNIDNSMLNTCQKAADEAMVKVCGDVSSCNAFNEDKLVGTESLTSRKDPNSGDFIISGLINYPGIAAKQSDAGYGFDTEGYFSKIPASADPVAKKSIQDALTSLDNKVAMIVNKVAMDPKVKMCVQGRDTTQILGTRAAQSNNARFPHLLDSYMNAIYENAIKTAAENYAKKFTELVTTNNSSATEEQNIALCSAMASNDTPLDLFGGEGASAGRDPFGVTYIIPGAKFQALQSTVTQGEENWVEVDGNGVMVASINTKSSYSKADRVCTLTTISKQCKSVTPSMYLSSYSRSWWGRRRSSSTFIGSRCSEYLPDQVTTRVVNMAPASTK
jgi:hypothetical protein